ncbi:MAG TPA: DNA polymerase IV [Ruminococcaceae bacterium]|nr:DNA polymerase IV [Oscillospiraceae bacterium]
MERTILHCDCNSFFASVECVSRPELKNVPMAVCGDPLSRHGIILAKNEPAKKFGIKTAETIWQAKRKCPELALVPTHFDMYREYYKIINEIYCRYTDLVEPFSIDESWLDVTGSRMLFGGGKKIADELRAKVKNETGITISAGVSFNKIFAKLGSDYKKPDATTVISRENYKDIVFPLPVNALMFCGSKVSQSLGLLGIRTIGELAAADGRFLYEKLGKAGTMLHSYANGGDMSRVRPFGEVREIKSVGNSITFKRDISGVQEIKKGIYALSDSVASRMRAKGVKCWVVQAGVKDPNFKTVSRQKTLSAPTCISKEVSAAAMELVASFWNMNAPVRLLSVTCTSLIPSDASCEQLCFFGGGRPFDRAREEKLEKTVDSIRAKYGGSAVKPCGLLNDDIGFTKIK